MNKQQYIQWLKERSKDPSHWEYRLCVEADSLIKEETLSQLAHFLQQQKPKLPMELVKWIMVCARHLYGSGETDDMLTALNLYPSWMDRKD